MTTIRPIFIDDTDSRIKYNGQWFQHGGSQDPSENGNCAPTYMHTMHGTKTNSSFSFSFNGTSVKIIGATYPTETDDNLNLSWDCYVDNLKIYSSKPAMDGQDNLLCQSDSLSQSEHRITVYITTQGQTFWLDSIQFIPRDGDIHDNATTRIENTDQALEWSTGWTAMPGNTTAKSTQVPDSSVRLNFIGTSVAWISRLSLELPRSASTASYSVDGGDQIPFTAPCPPQDDTDDLFNQPCFTTSHLGLGPHTLLVNYHGDNTSTPLNLDYLLVTNGTNSTSSSSTSSSTSEASQPSQPPPPTNSPNRKQGIIASIAVGVMGLIAVLSLITASIFFRRRRRRKKSLIPLKIMKRMSLLSGTRSPTNDHFTTTPAIYHNPDSIPSPSPSTLTFGSSHNLLAPPEEVHRRSPSPSSDAGSLYKGVYRDGATSPSSERVTGRLYVTNPSRLSISTCSVQAEVASTHSEEDEGKK